MEYRIPFNKPFIAGKELYYVAQSVLGGHTSGDGPFTAKCRDALKAQLGVHDALLTPSCTAALEMSALLVGVEPGDEVIVPSFTFVSAVNAFVMRGAVPVFADIRGDTLNLDETKLEELIPGAEELAQLFDDISIRARQVGVEVNRMNPEPTEAGAFYSKTSYQMSIAGEYHDVARVLTEIASLSRIVTPVELDMQPFPQPDLFPEYESPVLANFRIETYVLPDGTAPPPPGEGVGR